MERAIELAAARRPARACRQRPGFDIEVRVGAGAYVCGEETSLLESLEGKRGQVRAKPPLPAHQGPVRQADGHQQRDLAGHRAGHPGRGRRALRRARHGPLARHACRSSSPATSSMAACSRRAFGLTLGELVDDIGGGTATRPAGARRAGRRAARRLFPARAVRHAVRLRGLRRARRADRPWRHRRVRRHASTWRSRRASRMEFCAIESCGKCTPCRIGSTRGVETIDQIIARRARRGQPRAGHATSARR